MISYSANSWISQEQDVRQSLRKRAERIAKYWSASDRKSCLNMNSRIKRQNREFVDEKEWDEGFFLPRFLVLSLLFRFYLTPVSSSWVSCLSQCCSWKTDTRGRDYSCIFCASLIKFGRNREGRACSAEFKVKQSEQTKVINLNFFRSKKTGYARRTGTLSKDRRVQVSPSLSISNDLWCSHDSQQTNRRDVLQASSWFSFVFGSEKRKDTSSVSVFFHFKGHWIFDQQLPSNFSLDSFHLINPIKTDWHPVLLY